MSNTNDFYNPYEIPDDDLKDVLNAGPRNRKHAFGGDPCDACGGVIHNIQIPSDIPPEVADTLSEFLDTLPEEILNSAIIVAKSSPNTTKIISDFDALSKSLERDHFYSPLLQAIAETLDELTGGKVERLWRTYQSEAQLMSYHGVLKVLNETKIELESRTNTSVDDSALFTLLEKFLVDITGRIANSTEQYRLRAGETGVEVDEQIIESGVYSEGHRKSRFVREDTSEQSATRIGPDTFQVEPLRKEGTIDETY